MLVSILRALALAALVLTTLGAEDRSITVWWAQWAPADGLAKMGRAFEKETGIAVEVHQIPWPSFQNDVFLNFGKDQTDFDIVIGDSQWLGKAAESGWYLDLSDWIGTAVDLDSVHPQAKQFLCEYPAGSGRYFAAPCETDAIGLAYRKDWFEDAANKAAFQKQFGRPLTVPVTWAELTEVASFFQTPDEQRWGVVMLTGRGYDALTMGFEQVLYAHGGSWGDPSSYQVSGHLDSPGAVQAATVFKELCALGPPNAVNSDYGDTLASFKNGSTAMMLTYFAFFPDIVDTMGDKAGFATVPAGPAGHVISLGGQGMSISGKTSPAQQALAKEFIAWFSSAKWQQRWVTLPACFTADAALLKTPEFREATSYNAPFADSIDHLQDFWNVPEYGELLEATQKYLGKILDNEMEPAAALKACAAAHEAIFKREGRLE
ncbi:MAG: extracellular solute-binding protein [Planctomycetota bacterium]|jgi:multiple sugar transport system substrate-binding protein|nr:extracellular solute-binding protein [Planctomycetota bacterium]